MSRSPHIAVSVKKGGLKPKFVDSHCRRAKFRRYKCELCEKPAKCQCTGCKTTYYCCKEHQTADWVSIHEDICSDLGRLRSDLPSGNSDADDTARRVEGMYRIVLKEHLRTVAVERCRRHLQNEEWDKSVPAALQYLHMLVDLRGPDCPDIISVFIMLAEASTGMQKFDRAMEYLHQADWFATNLGRISDETKALFFRALGLLNVAQGNTEAARIHFLHQIHYALEYGGTSDILMANGYFQLAMVLVSEGKIPEAVKNFKRTIKPWMEFIRNISVLHLCPSNRNKPLSVLTTLNENEEKEFQKIIQIILDMSAANPGAFKANELALIYYTLSMLHLTKRDFTLMLEYGAKALREAEEISDRVQATKIHMYVEKSKVIADYPSENDTESTGSRDSVIFYDAESTMYAYKQDQIKEQQDQENVIEREEQGEYHHQLLKRKKEKAQLTLQEEEKQEVQMQKKQKYIQQQEELQEQDQEKTPEQPHQLEEELEEREQEKAQEQPIQDEEHLQEQKQEKPQEKPQKEEEEGV